MQSQKKQLKASKAKNGSREFPEFFAWKISEYQNDNDFLAKWNESDKKYLHMRRWDEKIITKMSEEI